MGLLILHFRSSSAVNECMIQFYGTEAIVLYATRGTVQLV